ncbi:MAG: hypothetical protein ABI142_09185, partial [Bryocella sp.]
MSKLSVFTRSIAVSTCAITFFLSGCAFSGSGVSTSGSGLSPLNQGNMRGVARGGRQGIYNATVTLYGMTVNTANYGDTPTTFAVTTTSDSNGDFQFTKSGDGTYSFSPSSANATSTWSCPANASSSAAGTTANPYLYIVAAGGDTSGNGSSASHYNNTYSKLLAVLGPCSSVTQNSRFTVNEATTVAAVVALQQFFNPATQAIGAPGLAATQSYTAYAAPYPNTLGLTNAVNMIPTLVDIGGGTFYSSVTFNADPSSSAAGVTITAASESAKLNTLANILAACVSSDGTGAACAALTANAVPPTTAPPGSATGQVAAESSAITNFPGVATYPAVADTLQAIDYMMINPTNSQDYGTTGRLNNLYTLSSSTSPFQNPAPLTVQPKDWTVGVNFTASGTCNAGVLTASVATPSQFVFDTYSMAVDKSGNIWIGGYSGAASSATNNILSEISPIGAPLACISANLAGGGLGNGRIVTIDSKGNVWYGSDQGLMEVILDSTNSAYAGTTSPKVLLWNQPLQGDQNGTAIPYKAAGMVADANGNIFIAPDAAPKASTGSGTPSNLIYEYPLAASSSTANGVVPVAIGNTPMALTSVPYRIITLNSSGNLVTTGTVNGNSGLNTFGYLNSNGTYTDTTLAASGTTFYGDALQLDGSTIVGTTGGGTGVGRVSDVSVVASTNPVNTSGFTPGGVNSTRSLAVDGAANTWMGGSGSYANDAQTGGTIVPVGEFDRSA